jgi:hypothetical protein
MLEAEEGKAKEKQALLTAAKELNGKLKELKVRKLIIFVWGI